jgi:DNA-directed RNA polymerase specialized sigma24 family protein
LTNTKDDAEYLVKTLKLVALISVESLPFKRQVWLMSKAGFQPTEIAELLDTTANSVNVRLSEMRRGSKKNERKETRG